MRVIGNDIAEFMEIEGRLMRNDRDIFANGKPGRNDFLAWTSWKVSPSIYGSMHTTEPARLSMVGNKSIREATASRLSIGEVP